MPERQEAYPIDTVGDNPMEALEEEKDHKHDDKYGVKLLPEYGKRE